MKKCPFCKAEIEENARFCLYCMTSLEEKQEIAIPKEKNKRWLVVLVAFLVLALFFTCIAFVLKKDISCGNPDKKPSESQTLSEADSNTPLDDADITADDSSSDVNLQNNLQNGSSENSNTNTDSNTTSSDKEQNNSTPSTSTPDTTATTATYLYRDAKYGDDFSVSANLNNCVVITGISTASSDGEYIIPETLGGKKVVAIMELAFCDANIKDTVKKVVVPASVKTIWGNAFANCYNLTDIYFCGQSIYVEENAFADKANRTGTLTIYCSYDCSDRNLIYYRNSAVNYDALYEEWDG